MIRGNSRISSCLCPEIPQQIPLSPTMESAASPQNANLGEKASPRAAPGAPLVPPCGYSGIFHIPLFRCNNGDRSCCEAGEENFLVKNSPKSPKSTKKGKKLEQRQLQGIFWSYFIPRKCPKEMFWH